MASTAGHQDYDANLLASAPVATKAQLRDGYDPVLLAEKQTPPSSQRDLEAGVPATETRDTAITPTKQPFYRTKKGIIIIFVAVVVIIAAVVGGAVGGSSHKKKTTSASDSQSGGPPPSSTASNSTTSSGSGDGNTQVVGGAPSSRPAAPDPGTTVGPPTSTSNGLPVLPSSIGAANEIGFAVGNVN